MQTAYVLSLFFHEVPEWDLSATEEISSIVTNGSLVYSIPVVRTRSALNFSSSREHGREEEQ